ncbi:hypothetical protein I4U23_001288 [Adineta vaga]|nr:hypothetical protein I4U23_001288 [Adineta vaga]
MSTKCIITGLSYNQPKLCPYATWNPNAITIVNQSIAGSRVCGLFVDNKNTIFIANRNISRVLYAFERNISGWKTINSSFTDSLALFVTTFGDIYVHSGGSNHRVDKWALNSSNKTTALYVTHPCAGLFIDINNDLYCSVRGAHKVVKKLFNNDANTSITIAGNGNPGAAPHQLNFPRGIYVDLQLNLYVADCENSRVQFFPPDQLNGTTILGNQTIGTVSIGCPSGIIFDADVPPLSVSFISPPCNDTSSTMGIYCNISSDLCHILSPCEHNGTCYINNRDQRGYICACPYGFSGVHCQLDHRLCKPSITCWNNGICHEIFNQTYECECREGWTGSRCEIQLNYCENIICLNSGVCQPSFLNYTCECIDSSYSGRHCEIVSNKIVVREFVSKSFTYVAIIALFTMMLFIVVMDIMKYFFGIDPVGEDMRRLKKIKKHHPVIVRFIYVNTVPSQSL